MSYTATTWVTGDIITQTKANNWETQYAGVFDSSDKTATGSWALSKASSTVPTFSITSAASYAMFGARGVMQAQASDASLVLGYNLVKRSSNWKNLANAGITYLSLSDTTVTLGVNASPGAAETTFTPTDRMTLTATLLTVTVAATLSSTLAVAGDVAVNTNKFTVAAASGNTVVAGTLGVTGASTVAALSATTGAFSSTLSATGDFAVNTSKFTVAASSGNTVVAGTLGVTGATTLATTLTISSGGIVVNTSKFNVDASNGNVSVNTNKFTVDGATGNTAVAGTFGATGASTIAALSATSGAFSTTLSATGNFAVNTNKFTVAAASGNTVVAGTLDVTGTTTLGALAAAAASFVSTVAVTGNFAINTSKFTVAAASGNTTIAGTLTLACSAAGGNSADIGNASATGYGAYLHGGGSDASHYQLIVADSAGAQSLTLSGTGALRLNQYGAGVLKTDSSGNVSATTSLGSVSGTFTGNLTGNVTGDLTGNASTVTNGLYTNGVNFDGVPSHVTCVNGQITVIF